MINEKRFLELYQRQKESGLSVKEFCSNEIIAPSTFYYWQKKLKESNRLPGFIPIEVGPDVDTRHHYKSKQALMHPSESGKSNFLLEFEYPNGTHVRVTKELDLTMLRALVHLYD